jgi:hypothetical protein
MKFYRIAAYIMGFIAFALSFLVYMNYIDQLGFPDSFITELGYAQRRLAWLFIGMSVLFGAGFIYWGIVALRKQVGKILLAAVVLYLVTIVSVLLVDYYYRLNLTGSGGG